MARHRLNLPLYAVEVKAAHYCSIYSLFLSRGDQFKWLPETYLFCNLLVLAVGVWAIASPENEDASQLVCTCTHNINQFKLPHRCKPYPKRQKRDST